jgi:hypothetical protein
MALDPAAVSKGVERRITNGIAACAYYVETKKVKEAAARRGRWPLRSSSEDAVKTSLSWGELLKHGCRAI